MPPGQAGEPADRATELARDLARRAKVACDLGGPLVVTPAEWAAFHDLRPGVWDEAVIAAYGGTRPAPAALPVQVRNEVGPDLVRSPGGPLVDALHQSIDETRLLEFRDRGVHPCGPWCNRFCSSDGPCHGPRGPRSR